MQEKFKRLTNIFSEKEFEKIQNANIILFGVGGVGGFVLETLIRSGIQNITIVDFDVVDESNINRQIIATENTIGKSKVFVAKERVLSINSEANIQVKNTRLTLENVEDFNLSNFDYVIDAIDSTKEKINLILYCLERNIRIISSMGAGNKRGIPNVRVMDVFKTHDDGLAKRIRKALKDKGIKKYEIVFAEGESVENRNMIGSFAPFPEISGGILASKVINDIVK